MKKWLIAPCLLSLSFSLHAAPENRQVLWGDTHLHTSNSADVYIFGLSNASRDTAYRFAKGLPVISPVTNTPVRLNRPLDFLVIADHAEVLGSFKRIFEGESGFADSKTGKIMREIEAKNDSLITAYGHIVTALFRNKDEATGLTGAQVMNDLHAGDKRRNTWVENNRAADFYNEPGVFTAFIGWEWSSMVDGANLHRVVLTDSDASKADQLLPFSQFDSSDPEDLWRWLGQQEQSLGMNFLAIPHNPNISRGKMFATTKFDGMTPIDRAYSEQRSKWEPLLEMTQIKGDSETHPVLSPNDEYADFETFNFILMPTGERTDPTPADYARSALKTGLELQAQTGVNPYKFGMIGSTDSHTGLSAVEETAFAGKAQHDAVPQRRHEPTGIGSSVGWDMSSAGFMAVWSDDNTRSDIFQAMQRKETYATTGPRISLRFFASWDFEEGDLTPATLAQKGYQKGVSMGGDLGPKSPSSKHAAPSFIIEAIADPFSATLDRIQIVKGWLDADGHAQEKVFNVLGANGQRPNEQGELAPITNTVNLETARYQRDSGSEALRALWVDPEFDPAQSAFYYVRVLEIPTPRYSLYDAIALDQPVEKTNKPATIQERAYSSPIWYTP